MITVSQIRAARGLLGWSQVDLAERTGLSQRSITSIETGKGRPSYDTLAAIESCFIKHDVEFIEQGVRIRHGYLTVIKGHDFADQFLDFVYHKLATEGIRDVRVNGINQALLTPAARAKIQDYHQKIKTLGVQERFLVPDQMDPAVMMAHPSQYRGIESRYFSDTTPTFIFGSYYAVMMFDIHEILIVKNDPLVQFLARQYDLLWTCGREFLS